MPSLLDTQIRKTVASSFKGKLLKGTLRRLTNAAVDGAGDSVNPTAATYSFEGIRDTFDLVYAVRAGIPVTDVRILIIAGLLAVTPKQDDQLFIRGQWHQIRKIIAIDPANATVTCQCFEIATPT